MITVANLVDDVNLGGVTRGVADLASKLGEGFGMQITRVRTEWRLAPRLHADIVVIDFTMSWVKLAFLASLRLRHRGAVVIVEHSYTAAFERECVRVPGRFRFMLRLSYALADRVVSVSEGQTDWLLQARLAAPDRLVCIPQAIGTEAMAALPLARRDGGPLRLCAYGRYAPQKGFEALIAAMRDVPPEVATLDLAGYGPDEGALQAAAYGLDHVRIHGPTGDPASFLGRFDCVVVPSRWEAYGLVAQEARAAGRPVIATAVDGLVEQLRAPCGTLVPPNNPGRLTEAIHAMAARDLAPLAAAARESTRGSLARKVEAWRALFQSLRSDADCESTPSRSPKMQRGVIGNLRKALTATR